MLKDVFICLILMILILCSVLESRAQIIDTAAVYEDNEIEFRFFNLKQSPATVDSIIPNQHQPGYTLVPALNTLPGVRMEERSPGSYRLSIRGSLLRSPFGIRNVKIYLNDFPLTDAGGNTYLNALDASGISSMEVWKGPYGSLYGANTGGVVRIRTYEQQETSRVSASLSGGSYGLFHQTLSMQHAWKKQFLKINQAFQRSDGYREQSALQRQFYQVSYHADYHKGMQFKALGFYSDLNYQTPGGLTLEEFRNNSRGSRPAAGLNPGAAEQKAQVYNNMLYSGIGHEASLGKHFRHVLSVFASHVDFKNPAISNYEVRKENTYGLRTYIEASGKQTYKLLWNWNVGAEWQKTGSAISNYRNNAGTKDTLLAENDVHARQYFFFTQFSATLFNRLIIEAGLSLNNYTYNYRSLSRGEDWIHESFDMQLMPRLACSYKIREQLLWRASVSKGYSPPTIAEIRPNDNVIHSDLQPEYGWNYETGLRFQNKRLHADVALFYYALKQAIVSRMDVNSNQYFINAGGTNQPGLETQVTYPLVQQRSRGLLRLMELKNSVTYYMFSFDQYTTGTMDYSGNRLTGVPRTVVVSSIFLRFAKGIHLYVQYNYTGKIPLNDASTAYASNYHLVQSKIGLDIFPKRVKMEIFFGIDNLFNQRYSLGNDLNAFGGRYYNAAPLRNFYSGMKIVF